MRRLLQIGVEVNSGSTGKISEQIGEVAISKGWQSYIAYARGYNPSLSQTIKIGNKFNIYYHVFQTRFFGNHIKSSTIATYQLIKKIKELRPDIIQLHQLHGYFLNLEVLFNFLQTLKIPIVWTLHDCWAFTGHCAYFSLVGCNKWETECDLCPQIHKYPKSYKDKSNENFHLKNQLFNSLQNLTIITVSIWLNNLVKKSFLKNLNVYTIQNGVNLNQFYPRNNFDKLRKKYNIPQGHIVMGVGTIWTKSKGFFDYIRLRDVLPESISIVLVGLTVNQIKNLPNGVIGIQRTENVEELSELYSLADVIMSLSYQESFGLTPIEGFACGTPAIVYNATALPELLTSDVGLIVDPGDLDGVNKAIIEIIQKGKSYYSSSCLKRAKEFFDASMMSESYLLLYNELLSKIN